METVNLILNIALIIAITFCAFWIVSNIRELKSKNEEITNTKIKNIWKKIDKLEEKINELENKNPPE